MIIIEHETHKLHIIIINITANLMDGRGSERLLLLLLYIFVIYTPVQCPLFEGVTFFSTVNDPVGS